MSRRSIYLVVLVPPLTRHNAQDVFEALRQLGLHHAPESRLAYLKDIVSTRPREPSDLPAEPTDGQNGHTRSMDSNGGEG